MSNNKQSSIDLFIEQLEEKGGAWENASMNRIEISISVEEYLALKEQAKALHKKEIIEVWIDAYTTNMKRPTRDNFILWAENYYEQTYGGNK